MKNVNMMGKIVMKVLEVGHWVAAGLMAAVGICAAVAPQFLKYFMDVEGLLQDGELSVYGFEVMALNPAGQIHTGVLTLYAVGAVILFAAMALAFHNLYWILKRSETASPFQNENIRNLKIIGIISFSVPLIGLFMSIVIRLAVGPDAVELSMDQSGVIMGILILCLTQFFIHGAQLEQDVEGLV